MTQANDSINVTPGSGAVVATHLVASKEHAVEMEADESGHILGTVPTYRLYIPAGAAGASKVYFDLFNATGSGKTLRVLAVKAVKNGDTGVTGVVTVRLFLTRTSAIGTGGTAATADGSSLTAATISKMNPNDAALPAGVTARLAPTGGATAGAVISERHIFPEETNSGSLDAIDFLGHFLGRAMQPLTIPENTGLRIVQGTVASVGNTGFDVIFEAV